MRYLTTGETINVTINPYMANDGIIYIDVNDEIRWYTDGEFWYSEADNQPVAMYEASDSDNLHISEDLQRIIDGEDDPISTYWEYDDTTREWCFYGRHLNAFYEDDVDDNDNVRVTFFAVENATGGRLGCGTPVAHSDMITLPKKVADSIIEDIEMNPQDYYLQSYLDYKGDTVYTLCKYLEKMPFDKNGVHATGSAYLETNGDWVTEYEDDIPEGYTPKYIYFKTGRDSQY